MKKFIAGILLLMSQYAFGQADLDQLLKGSKADANYLAEGYLKPFMNSVGSGLSQGWYNTAANHKKFGFDLTISTSLIYYPASDETYFVDNSKLTNIKIVTPSNGMAPTIFGSKTAPTYDYKTGVSAPFQGPPGVDPKGTYGFNAIPLPILNLGVGLPFNTDLKVRFLPTTSVGSGTNISVLGFGIMHDIKQYIPGLKMVPIDLSAFVGYTTFKTDVAFDPVANPNQKGTSTFSSTTIQGLISKKLSVLTLYGGAGYNFSNGSFKATGTYDAGQGVTLTDPVNVSASVSGPRFTAGMRLKFAVFTLHGDYTFQRYNTLTVGFGISVR